MASIVGGNDSPAALVPAGLGSVELPAVVMAAGATVGAAAGVAEVIARTACSTRSASRRLRSSDTLSVGSCLRTVFLAGAGGLGLVWTRSGSLIWTRKPTRFPYCFAIAKVVFQYGSGSRRPGRFCNSRQVGRT